MDIKDLSAKASARCGIRVEPWDPAFVFVAINQLVLEETVVTIYQQLETRLAAFAESIRNDEAIAARAWAQQISVSGSEIRRAIQGDMRHAGWKAQELILQINRKNSRAALIRWMAIGMLVSILMFIAGVSLERYVPLQSIWNLR
jgi:predicted nucleic acid-binding Zn ribbon protein